MKKNQLNILMIDKDVNYLKKIKKILKENQYNVFTCTTSQYAIYIQRKIHPEIIITSLEPYGFLKNESLIHTLVDIQNPPLIILLIYQQEEDKLKQISQLQIFEILYFNERIEHLILTSLESAKKYIKEKNTLFEYLNEYKQSRKRQIEWYLWKEYHKTIFRTNFSKKLIDNIRNSLLQGLGINSIVSYIDLIDLRKKENNDELIIPNQYFIKLKHSVERLSLWLQNLEKLIQFMNLSFEMEKINVETMRNLIKELLEEIEEFRSIKNQNICIGEFYFNDIVIANKKALKLIFKEILINAFKYSPDNSRIDIISFNDKNKILIGFINDILEFKGGITGIPEEYENQVFEPFVRLNHHYDERFLHEDFSLGTGLSIVKLYLQYFQGQIYIKEIMDYSGEPKKRILCEISLNKADE